MQLKDLGGQCGRPKPLYSYEGKPLCACKQFVAGLRSFVLAWNYQQSPTSFKIPQTPSKDHQSLYRATLGISFSTETWTGKTETWTSARADGKSSVPQFHRMAVLLKPQQNLQLYTRMRYTKPKQTIKSPRSTERAWLAQHAPQQTDMILKRNRRQE